MIVAPEWTTLRGIASGLDNPDPVQRKVALERTLRTIMEALPDVTAVRLYDVEEGGIVVRAATDLAEMSIQSRSRFPELDTLFKDGQSQWRPDAKQWLCPLQLVGEPVGLFEVLVDDLDADWIAWLDVIAEQISPRLAAGRLTILDGTGPTKVDREQAQRIVNVSRMLAASQAYDEAVTAALYVAEETVKGVMLTLFDQPLYIEDSGAEGIAQNGRYTAAIATRDESGLVDRHESVGEMPDVPYLNKLRTEIPVMLEDVGEDAGYLTGWMRERTMDMGGQQVVSFGLLAAEQVVGTMDLLYDETTQLAADEIDFYATVANQIASTILSKRLLQQSLETQEFAAQLVTTNKSLAVAESYEEMAAAVLEDAPRSVYAVAIALFNRPFTLTDSPVSLRTQAVVARDGREATGFVDPFSAAEDARVTYFLHEFLEGSMMMLWSSERSRQPVMADSLVSFLQQFDVDQITAFGLNVRASLRGLVVFAGDSSLRDPGPQYDGLRAIADQLAAVIENRILLQQTSDALDLIQSQYETSSRVFRTNDLSEILRAVYDFAGGDFEQAEMVHTDALGVVRVVAEVTADGGSEVARPVSLADYPASSALVVLEALEIRDVSEDAFINEDERAALQARGIASLVILPILIGEDLSGLIMLASGKPGRVPPDRLRAMRSLADQVGVVLQNGNLLQTMEENLNEIQLLYEANREMLRTQDTLDVLRVVRSNLAPDSSAILQFSVDYDSRDQNRVSGITLDYELTADEERVLREMLPVSGEEGRAIYQYLRQADASGNVTFSPEGDRIPSNPLSLIGERYEIESFVTFFVRERGKIVSLVYLLFDYPRAFPDSARRLYEAIGGQVSIAIDNQKLLQESQIVADRLGTQVKALQTISGLAVELNNIRDERKLLNTGARAMVDSVGVDHCGIVLFNDDMQTGVLAAEYPVTDFMGITVSTKDNPILAPNRTLSDPVIINNLATDPQVTDFLREFFLDGGIRSLIIIPLIGADNELVGSVGLDVFDEPRPFLDSEVQTAQTIASQLAVGLQNVRLLRDAQTRAEQLQQIADFSSAAQSTLDVGQLVQSALVNVPRVLAVTHMAISLYDEARETLVLVGGWEDVSGYREPLETGGLVSLETTTSGYVFETGEYLYIPNLESGTQLMYPHSDRVKAVLAMPLMNQGRLFGVVTVATSDAADYTDTDIAVFQQLISQLSVAIDNARSYTQSQEIARNKTIANDIALQLQQQGDMQRMVNLTMNEVGRALGAKRARLRLKTTAERNEKTTPNTTE